MATTGILQALSDYLKNPDNILTTTQLINSVHNKEVKLPECSTIVVCADDLGEVYSHFENPRLFWTNDTDDTDDTVYILYRGYFYTKKKNNVYVLTKSDSMPKINCLDQKRYVYDINVMDSMMVKEFCRINKWPVVNFRCVGGYISHINVEIINDFENDKFTFVCLWEEYKQDRLYYYRVIIKDKSSGAMYVVDSS